MKQYSNMTLEELNANLKAARERARKMHAKYDLIINNRDIDGSPISVHARRKVIEAEKEVLDLMVEKAQRYTIQKTQD